MDLEVLERLKIETERRGVSLPTLVNTIVKEWFRNIDQKQQITKYKAGG